MTKRAQSSSSGSASLLLQYSPLLFFLFTSFFPLPLLCSLLISRSTSRSHSAFCPLRFCHPRSAAGEGRPRLLPGPPALQRRQQLQASPLVQGCTHRALLGEHPRIPSRTAMRGAPEGASTFSTPWWWWQEVAIHQGCLWTGRVGFASLPPKVCEKLNLLFFFAPSQERAVTAGASSGGSPGTSLELCLPG